MMVDEDTEIIEIEYDSDGDEIVEIEEYVDETDSEASYEEEVLNELAVLVEEDEEESEDEPEPEEESEDSDDELPAWAKMKLKKTSMGDKLKQHGNLQAPITFTPYKNTDFTNNVVQPSKLKQTEKGQHLKNGEYLSAPITFTPYKNTDFTNKVVNPSKLKHTENGEHLKQGG
jgi:hypothetical protein